MTTSGALPSSSHTTQERRSRWSVPSTTKTSGPRKSFRLACRAL